MALPDDLYYIRGGRPILSQRPNFAQSSILRSSVKPAAATGETNPKMSLPEQAFSGKDDEIEGIRFVDYKDESQLERVMSLVGRDLSEPYSSEYLILVRCGFVYL